MLKRMEKHMMVLLQLKYDKGSPHTWHLVHVILIIIIKIIIIFLHNFVLLFVVVTFFMVYTW